MFVDTPQQRRVGVVVVLALVLGLVVLTVNSVMTMRQTQDLRAQATRVTADERTADANSDTLHEQWERLTNEVAEAKVELDAADAARTRAGDELASTTADYQAARAELDQLQAALAATTSAAHDAGNEVNQRAAVTQALADCLTGVSQVLNALSVGDTGRALTAARDIREPCALVGVAVQS